MTEQRADYDSPWKESLDKYFAEFIAFFFPHVHADIDWTKGYEFLDTELQQIVRDAELGRRLADKLLKKAEVRRQMASMFPTRLLRGI